MVQEGPHKGRLALARHFDCDPNGDPPELQRDFVLYSDDKVRFVNAAPHSRVGSRRIRFGRCTGRDVGGGAALADGMDRDAAGRAEEWQPAPHLADGLRLHRRGPAPRFRPQRRRWVPHTTATSRNVADLRGVAVGRGRDLGADVAARGPSAGRVRGLLRPDPGERPGDRHGVLLAAQCNQPLAVQLRERAPS